MADTPENQPSQAKPPLGILAGGGDFPLEIAQSAARSGRAVHIVALDGEADRDFAPFPTTSVNWGQIGKMMAALRKHGIRQMVFVGRVSRPELTRLKPDMGFFKNLPAIIKIVASGGDDSVLRRVIRVFEKNDLEVIGPADAAPELIISEGPLATQAPATTDIADIDKGFDLIRALGPYDVGQAVVVANGTIVAIEGVEGTDRVLERVKHARTAAHDETDGGILIKRTKPSQELRIDMPAIGPQTVIGAHAARLTGVAVEAERCLVANRTETMAAADKLGLFVVGRHHAAETTDAAPVTRFKASGDESLFRRLGAHAPTKGHRKDAEKGAAVSKALAPFQAGEAVIVIRNHVIAVSANETPLTAIERASQLRQWTSVSRSRRGTVVLRNAADLTLDLVEKLDATEFAAVVVFETRYDDAPFRQALGRADKCGICVLMPATPAS